MRKASEHLSRDMMRGGCWGGGVVPNYKYLLRGSFLPVKQSIGDLVNIGGFA